MDIASSFFSSLAQRFGKEVDLCDVTWAICQASQSFQMVWITFFFPELENEIIESIEREVPDGKGEGSRVDFFINVEGRKPYMIEVKIWDRNHHFGQYEKSYRVGKDHLGYITNYPLRKEGYKIRQWKEFYQLLKSIDFPEQEKSMIAGYCEYIRNICGITMIEGIIDLEKTTCLYDLTFIFHELAFRQTDHYDSVKCRDFANNCSKYTCLTVRYKNNPEWRTQYPIIGIWYNHNDPRICAGFFKDKSFAKRITDFMKANHHSFPKVERKYCSLPIDKGDYYFKFSDEAKSAFTNAATVEDQKTILREFLDEALMFPVKLWEIVNELPEME